MTLVRRNQNWLPLFHNIFGNEWQERESVNAPAINIKEHKTGFEVEVAAPGLTKNDFSIRIDETDNLVISVEKEEKFEEKTETCFLRREFGYEKFTQSLVLPENIDKEHITAKMEHGVLQIFVPKLTEEELKKAQRQIEIK
jgi:HSP20 family protein